MTKKWLKSALVSVIALLFIAPPCWAKAKGYCFIIGYSYKLKKVYTTPVFMVMVKDVSYNQTQYVADVALIQKMEAQFQDHLARIAREDPDQFTVAARGAYKNMSQAQESQTREIEAYAKKKFEVFDIQGFNFKK